MERNILFQFKTKTKTFMNKKKHLHTNFIRFILEKYSQQQEDPQSDIEDEIERPSEEDQDEFHTKRIKIKKMNELEDEIEEPERTEDDDVIDELLKEYKKIKKQYESRKLSIRRKR